MADGAKQLRVGDADARTVRRVPLFSGLSDGAFERLAAKMHPVNAAAGATLFIQGEPAQRFFVLLEGWIKLSRVTEEGDEAIVNVVAPGETFAEAAVFAQGRYPVCAEAVTDVRTLALEVDNFGETALGDREIALAMLGSLSLRLRQLVRQIESLQVKSAPQRVADFLLHLCPAGAGPCEIDLPLHKSLIARRLGMRPETFSRALAQLRTRGVKRHASRLAIANVAALRAFAEAGNEDGSRTCC